MRRTLSFHTLAAVLVGCVTPPDRSARFEETTATEVTDPGGDNTGEVPGDSGRDDTGAPLGPRPELALDEADALYLGESADDAAGTSVAAVGDVTGDGEPDLVIGAWGSDRAAVDAGAAFLLHGPLPSGAWSLGSAPTVLEGEAEDDWAGTAVGPAGDLDQDGQDDLLIGARQHDGRGAVYVFYGPVAPSQLSLANADAKLLGELPDDAVGGTLPGRAVGDLTGDGRTDLVIPSLHQDPYFFAGAVYVVSDPPTGTSDLGLASAKIHGTHAFQTLGEAAAADVTGDGVADLLMGAPGDNETGVGAGAAFWQPGPIAGVMAATDTEAKLSGMAAGDYAGQEVAAGSDVDGDGLADLAVGAPQSGVFAGSSAPGGKVYLMYGAPAPGTTPLGDAADAVIVHEELAQYAGGALLVGPDLDGDGGGDLVVGAPWTGAGVTTSGSAYEFLGPLLGVVDLADYDARIDGVDADAAGIALAAIERFGGGDDLAVGAVGSVGDPGRVGLFVDLLR